MNSACCAGNVNSHVAIFISCVFPMASGSISSSATAASGCLLGWHTRVRIIGADTPKDDTTSRIPVTLRVANDHANGRHATQIAATAQKTTPGIIRPVPAHVGPEFAFATRLMDCWAHAMVSPRIPTGMERGCRAVTPQQERCSATLVWRSGCGRTTGGARSKGARTRPGCRRHGRNQRSHRSLSHG